MPRGEHSKRHRVADRFTLENLAQDRVMTPGPTPSCAYIAQMSHASLISVARPTANARRRSAAWDLDSHSSPLSFCQPPGRLNVLCDIPDTYIYPVSYVLSRCAPPPTSFHTVSANDFLPIMIISSHLVFEYYVLVEFPRATPTMSTAFAS